VIIDSHTHRYPPEVFADAKAFAKERQEHHWLELVLPQKGTQLQGWADRSGMIGDMEEAGIDRCVLLAWYWENPETCLLHNQWHAQWIKEDPERFYAFAAVHPAMKDPVEELRKMYDKGFSGIGECHPWAQGFSLRDPNWLSCMEFAQEKGWPVNFHVTEPVGHDYPGRIPTPFEDFHWLAREFSELKVILSHAGGLFPFYELNPRLKPELKNIYYDLAACPLLYDPSLYRLLIDAVGYEKIIWGSDYPLKVFPGQQKKPDFSTFRNDFIARTKLTEVEQKAIFGHTFLSILN
jgi:predicted TIM-barrel fold metal-dependent hydrolase